MAARARHCGQRRAVKKSYERHYEQPVAFGKAAHRCGKGVTHGQQISDVKYLKGQYILVIFYGGDSLSVLISASIEV